MGNEIITHCGAAGGLRCSVYFIDAMPFAVSCWHWSRWGPGFWRVDVAIVVVQIGVRFHEVSLGE